MALGFSVTHVPIKYAGGYRVKLVQITLDNAYPTGGWAITPAQVGLDTTITRLIPLGFTLNGFGLSWDQANRKLKALKFDYPAAAAGAAIEAAANEAGLNGQVVHCLVVGV